MSFKKHIYEKITKAKKHIGIIKHLSQFLPLKTLDQIYKSLVRPHLDYCDVIYHIPTIQTQLGEVLNSLMEKVEQVQYKAALAVTGSWQGSSRSKLYDELGWESLTHRRYCRRILKIQKIVINQAPSYLHNKLPRRRRPLYMHNNENAFYQIRCNTSRYMNSFFPNGIGAWNNFINNFEEIPSINVLKTHILSIIRPVKKDIFNIHNPVGIHYLFYLRVGLSPLKNHKKRHGFEDTPLDRCVCENGIEDTAHFILFCPLFDIQRAALRASVITILHKYNLINLLNDPLLYLYGSRTINFADNKQILLSTIEFIKNSKRFSE